MNASTFFRCFLIIILQCSAFSFENNDEKNSTIPTRVDRILKSMTTEQMIYQTFAAHTQANFFEPILISKGVGAVKYAAMNGYKTTKTVEEMIQMRNQLQKDFISKTGIPISFVNEGNHVGASGGTIFPMPVGQGCSWNVSLVYSIASVVAAEASAIGVDTLFAPVVNMVVDPRFGRGEENFSENPILSAHLGKASVLGLQQHFQPGEYFDKSAVAALGKHFAAYGDATGGLNGSPPSSTSERMLFDVYLRPWRSMAKAGMKGLMAVGVRGARSESEREAKLNKFSKVLSLFLLAPQRTQRSSRCGTNVVSIICINNMYLPAPQRSSRCVNNMYNVIVIIVIPSVIS